MQMPLLPAPRTLLVGRAPHSPPQMVRSLLERT
jgi:hypothetical protein